MKNFRRILLLFAFLLCTLATFAQKWSELDKSYDGLYASGDYKAALKVAEDALVKAEKEYLPADKEYYKSIKNLADCNRTLENYDKAISYYSELFSLQVNRISVIDVTFASTCKTMVDIYKYIAENKMACDVYSKALERLSLVNEVDNKIFTELSGYYTDAIMAQYQPEKKSDDQLVESVKAQYGEESTEYVNILDSLGNYYKTMVKYKEGMKVSQELYELRKKMGLDNTIEHATTIINMGYLSVISQEYDKCIPYYEEARALWNKNKFKKGEDYVTALFYYSIPYQIDMKPEKAKEIINEAYDVCTKKLSKDYILYSTILLSMGGIYRQTKEYELSEKYYNEYLDFLIEKNDTSAGSRMSYNMGIAPVYESLGKLDKADEAYVNYNISTVDIIDLSFQYVTISSEEKVARSFVWFQYNLNSFYSYCFKRMKENPALAAQIYNNELISKGLILRALKSKVDIVLNSGDEELIADFDSWTTVRQKMSKLKVIPISERKLSLLELEKEAMNLENKMSSKLYQSKDKGSLIIDWKEVQKNLKNDEAAIEFIHFDYFDNTKGYWTDSNIYCALVLRKEYDYPRMVYLFEESDFANFLARNKGKNPFDQVRRLYTWFSGTYRDYYKGDSLYHYIWKPITPMLEGINKIYYSPTGILHKISYGGIPIDKDKALVDNFSLQHMSSTGLLTHDKEPLEVSDKFKALLYGGIFYDINVNEEDSAINLYKDANSDLFIRDRSFDWSSKIRGGGSWSYLQGTFDEVQDIDSMFLSNNVKTKMYSRSGANEESFKLAVKNKNEIIHIATHGFFLPEQKIEKKDQFLGMEQAAQLDPDDALRRSGLLFAGANNTWKGMELPEGREDGILTAYEVSKMNLTNTKLVVLSACETGLGDIHGGEGVYGLQRAFKMAGVKYIIMSLWQIPDEQTVELMNIFYNNWLKGEDIREAFYAAQKEMSTKYEPYYWAAFVLVE